MTNRALCIGINDYPGTQNDLRGCVNDAQDWGGALTARGFGVSYLIDNKATGAAMVSAIRSLIHQAAAGDTIVLTYSGHGTWVPDTSGDEADGHDEALCPHDVMTAGPLLDDVLDGLFRDVVRGVNFVFVADSCFSGTVSRFSPFGGAAHHRVRFLPPGSLVAVPPSAVTKAVVTPRSMAKNRAITFSGAQDTEYSYDALFGSRYNGAFTRAALDALDAAPPGVSYGAWFKAIRAKLPSAEYPQRPNLTATATQKKLVAFA